ncbi:MAG: hypothetical protein WCP55_06240 [Lentisphaerota bacterium]
MKFELSLFPDYLKEAFNLLKQAKALLAKQEEQVKASVSEQAAKSDKAGRLSQAAAVKEHLKKALEIAEKGKTEKRPAFFGPSGGVTSELKFAREALEKLKVSGQGAEEAGALEAEIQAAEKQAAEVGASLKAQAIAEVQTPPDKYRGCRQGGDSRQD